MLFLLHNCAIAQDMSVKDINLGTIEFSKSRDEIQKLIREVLVWGISNESIDLLPTIKNAKENVYIGFDMKRLKENLNKLEQTGFFSKDFIENYNHIIRTIDKKLRNKELEEWHIGDLPTFKFVNGINPWCQCQGFSKENVGNVEIIKIDNSSGDLKWQWEKGSSWQDFIVRVVKENNKWKITYMEGFDYKECIK